MARAIRQPSGRRPTSRRRTSTVHWEPELKRSAGVVERAYLLAVERKGHRPAWPTERSLAELASLVETAGADVAGSQIQRVESFSPSHLAGKGKVEELKELKALLGFNVLVVDNDLSPTQNRSLEQDLQVKVVDRAAVILDIFAQRATTHEAKLQVELAQLEYMLPRLTGLGTVLSRTGGGINTRGPGETQIETDRRKIRQRVSGLKRELEEVRQTRSLHRAHRARQGIPVVSLVGYTNAGKSTLMNALTSAGVAAENALFATLEPTTRQLHLPGGKEALLTDTVGFIQNLPAKLVAAFRATLEELAEAALLLVVVDASDPDHPKQYDTVIHTIADLGLHEKPAVVALNKVDRLPELPPSLLQLYPDSIPISAVTEQGLDRLLDALSGMLEDGSVRVTVRIPYDRAELVGLFRQRGRVESEQHGSAGTLLHGRLPRGLWPRFKPFEVAGAAR